MKTIFLLLSITLFSQSYAQDWPKWRGPAGNGRLENAILPSAWPEKLQPVWQIKTGVGYSAPIVVEQSIYLLSREQDATEVLSRHDLASGKEIWRHTNKAPFKKNPAAQRHPKGSFSTPLYHNGRIYSLGVNALLKCLDARDGKLLWQRHYSDRITTDGAFYGTAMSPIAVDSLIIVHVGDAKHGAIIAYELTTGRQKWILKKYMPGFSTPIVKTISGVKQLITLSLKSCIGVEINSGKALWEIPFLDEYCENIVDPVYENDILLISGVRLGTYAYRLKLTQNTWKIEKVWHSAELPMYMSSPVVYDDVIFGFSPKRKGQLFCRKIETGEILWQTEGKLGSHGALIAHKDILFVATEDGILWLLKPNPKAYEALGKYQISENMMWAFPVILNNGVLARDVNGLTFRKF